MGITAKSKSNAAQNSGMGLLLVFFPDANSSAAATSTAIVDEASPSSSSTLIKRTNSNNPILTKTQSTISICALLLFLTLLLFTLSTFEPTAPDKTPRRFLPGKLPVHTHHSVSSNSDFSWFSRIYQSKNGTKGSEFPISFALQGMGKLYFRGTRAMNDLVVGHLVEDVSEDEFKLFLRLLHRSGLTAKADIVFMFSSSSWASKFQPLIQEENHSFLELIHRYQELNRTSHDLVSAAAAAATRFDLTQFVNRGKKEMGEPLWGKRIRVNNYNDSEESECELTRLSYGSVVGFEASELDPENSLSGFLDHVPMSLRRWACYPMLLGRLRRNFKHVMLVDVKKSVLLSDPLSRVRNHSPEFVYISTKQETTSSKHGRRNSDKTQSHPQVNSAILMGGIRGIRRLSSAMLTEIVRFAMQHKKKSSITESTILSELVSNGHILKNIELTASTESIPEASSLSGSNSKWWEHHKIIQRGNANHDLNSIVMKHICSSEVDSFVYRDCHS